MSLLTATTPKAASRASVRKDSPEMDTTALVIMVALWNRADHYIFMLLFVLSSFFLFLPFFLA